MLARKIVSMVGVELSRRVRLGLLAIFALCGLGSPAMASAAEDSQSGGGPASRWHVVETANLRLLNFGPHAVDRATAEGCEALRARLVAKWLTDSAAEASWNPKCDIVLHPSDDAYAREVGQGARNTVASSLVDRKLGRIARRRIDVRGTQPRWQSAALSHELTHLVLADRFPDQLLPRWADEGAAILADPVEKRWRHSRDLKDALSSRTEFRVLELITLNDYPPSRRWGTFYGQSASLVEFLVSQGGEEQFIEFLDLSFEHGYERALNQVYRFGTLELERRWREHLKRSVRSPHAEPNNSASASAPRVQGARVSAETVSLHTP